MNTLEWLNSLRPAIPMSVERPCELMSTSELRRHIQQGAVLINGERVAWGDLVKFPVVSLVFFPKSTIRRTTII